MLKEPEIGSPTGERANNRKEEEERATIYKYSALQWSLFRKLRIQKSSKYVFSLPKNGQK